MSVLHARDLVCPDCGKEITDADWRGERGCYECNRCWSLEGWEAESAAYYDAVDARAAAESELYGDSVFDCYADDRTYFR
jgi:ribosomal protein L37AE/L43A